MTVRSYQKLSQTILYPTKLTISVISRTGINLTRFPSAVVVTIGLVPTSVTVSEDDGEVVFCAEVTGDVALGRSVQVTLSTQPGSATGNYSSTILGRQFVVLQTSPGVVVFSI